MTSQPGIQTIEIHQRYCKGSHFFEYTYYSMSQQNKTRETFFLKFIHKNKMKKLVPDPFLKKSKLNISPDQKSKVLYSLFLLYDKFRALKIYRN